MNKTYLKFTLLITLCAGTLTLPAQSFKNVAKIEAEADYFIDFGNDVFYGIDEKTTLRKEKYTIYRMNNGKVDAEYAFENEHDKKAARFFRLEKMGEKLYLFEKVGTEEDVKVSVSELNVETLQPKGDSKKIVSLENEQRYAWGYYDVISSKNNEFHYLEVDDKRFLLNREFEILSNLSNPAKLKDYDLRNSVVSNDGSVYSLYTKMSTTKPTIESLYITKTGLNQKVILKELGKGLYLELDGFLTNNDGSLVLAGFTGVIQRASLLQSSFLNKQFMRDGYYFVHLSKDLDVISENQHSFDADFFSNGEKQLEQNRIARKAAKGKRIVSPILSYRDLIKAKDGYYLMGEEASSSINSEGKIQVLNGTIYAIRLSETGEFKECVKIFRKYYSTSKPKNFKDFDAFVHNNELYVLFEDLRVNDDVITEDRVRKIVDYENSHLLRTYVVKISEDDITKKLLSQKYDETVVNRVSTKDDGSVFLNLINGRKISYKVELGFDE